MKKWTSTLAVVGLVMVCMIGTSWAANGECNAKYAAGFQSFKKDGQCGKYFRAWTAALARQRAECRRHRDSIRKCNMARRHEAKACRGQKRTCKRVCRDTRKSCRNSCRKGKRTCVKACPRGRRGKNCRRSCKSCVRRCNKRKRSCKRVCRGNNRTCQQASRRKAHSCRSLARTIGAFRVCQDARAMSRKAGGNITACAWKHFKDPLECTAKDAGKIIANALSKR